MDKITAQKLLEMADATADAILSAKYEFFDILDKEQGAEYDRIVFNILAREAPDMTIFDFLTLAA